MIHICIMKGTCSFTETKRRITRDSVRYWFTIVTVQRIRPEFALKQGRINPSSVTTSYSGCESWKNSGFLAETITYSKNELNDLKEGASMFSKQQLTSGHFYIVGIKEAYNLPSQKDLSNSHH